MMAAYEKTIRRHDESGAELQCTTAGAFGEGTSMCRHCLEQSRYYFREVPPTGPAYSWDGPYCNLAHYVAGTGDTRWQPTRRRTA